MEKLLFEWEVVNLMKNTWSNKINSIKLQQYMDRYLGYTCNSYG